MHSLATSCMSYVAQLCSSQALQLEVTVAYGILLLCTCTGLREVRNPCLFVARIGVFDRANNRFLGNVLVRGQSWLVDI